MSAEIITAEVVKPLDRADAERLDRRIRLMVNSITDSLDKLHSLVEQAKSGAIHQTLDYPSWTAYISDVFTISIRLDRPHRRELVEYLSGQGMSQRAIADVVGVDQKTVSNDLRVGEENSSPDVADYFADAEERADAMAMADLSDAEFEAVLAEARQDGDLSRGNVADKSCRRRQTTPTTGLDGKTYRRKPRPVVDEHALRAAARQEELNAWGRACDGLIAALSWANDFKPPADTDIWPTVGQFRERLGKLTAIADGWEDGSDV